jgi:CRP-like cAMP-binding protein
MDRPWYLQNTGWLRRMTDEDMMLFMRICPERRYSKGECLFRAGDPATALHIVVRGQVKLTVPTASGHERILVVCGAQDFIGSTFVAESALYQGDAVALTETVTCPVTREQFRTVALHSPHTVLTFTEIMASQLAYCRSQLSDYYSPIKTRLTKVLLEQAGRFGQPAQDGWVRLETELKHSELASMVSGTRVSVSTAIGELRREGLMEGSRGDYLLDVAGLEAGLEA